MPEYTEAGGKNLYTAHDALVTAKHCLFAASWQVDGEASEIHALANDVEALVHRIHAIRFQPSTTHLEGT